jgi:hypothetical protein
MSITVAWCSGRSRIAAHHGICEHVSPLGKAAVGGQDDRAPLVAAGHDLEDPVRRLLIHGEVTELVALEACVLRESVGGGAAGLEPRPTDMSPAVTHSTAFTRS